MKPLRNQTQPGSSMVDWLDRVQMSAHDRKIAKAYLRKTEAMWDFIWLASASIRAVFAGAPANRAPLGTGLSRKEAVAAHLP